MRWSSERTTTPTPLVRVLPEMTSELVRTKRADNGPINIIEPIERLCGSGSSGGRMREAVVTEHACQM